MPADARPLIVEAHTTLAGLEGLRTEWSRLWRQCPSTTPFQSAEWVLAWCRAFRPDALCVLALRRGGRLVGVAPFHVYRAGDRRVLTLLGADVSDYLDVLLAPEERSRSAEAILAHLAERFAWDACELPQLAPGSPLADARAPDGMDDEVAADAPTVVASLPATVEELRALLSRKRYMELKQSRKRAMRMGAVTIDEADPHTCDAHLDALFDLHRARWTERGSPGVLEDSRVQALHREAARGLAEAGALRLYRLRLDQRVAAILYGFLKAGRVYLYLSGFDPALHELSPGTLVIGHAIEQAVREGATAFDFLRGQEEYKYAWGARDTVVRRRTLRRKSRLAPGRSTASME